jgi:diguanylate cyclase
VKLLAGIFGHLRAVAQWVHPPVPASIRAPLQNAQFQSVRRQVPMLLLVAALNVLIVMAVCYHDGVPTARWAWMSVLIVYCFVRIAALQRQFERVDSPEKIARTLKINVTLSLIMIVCLGVATTFTFVAGYFASPLLVPMSLGFGATCIAHCLYTLRPAAIGVLVMGLVPSSVAMLLVGSFDAQLLGLSMLSVAALMIRFVAAQYDQLVTSLHMERQIRELADTDPLTGLANRRAIMVAIEAEQVSGKSFGIALLDLDGFKEVNDRLGHHAGDAMLIGVAERLREGARPGDHVGRLGGDEFILLCRNVADKDDLSARATAILAGLCLPINLDGVTVPVAASLGFAQYPDDGASIREVIHAADVALYAVKHARSDATTHAKVAKAA